MAVVVAPTGAVAYLGDNGLKSATNVFSESATNFNGELDIGRDSNQTTRYFDGNLDDCRFYNRSLSASEVKDIYTAGLGGGIVPGRNATTTINATVTPPNLTKGLVGHWTFDGPDMIDNVTDSSGNGNNGDLVGFTSTSSAVTPGVEGQALAFDGTGEVQTSYAGVSGTNPRTISMWLKTTQTSPPSGKNTSTVLSYGDGGCAGGDFVFATNDKYGGASNSSGLTIDTPCSGAVTYAADSLYDGQWHHVVVLVPDGSLADVRMYIDGSLLSTVVNESLGTFSTGSGDAVLIGNDALAGNGGFVGGMDDVRIYDRLLSAAEVEELYQLGK